MIIKNSVKLGTDLAQSDYSRSSRLGPLLPSFTEFYRVFLVFFFSQATGNAVPPAAITRSLAPDRQDGRPGRAAPPAGRFPKNVANAVAPRR